MQTAGGMIALRDMMDGTVRSSASPLFQGTGRTISLLFLCFSFLFSVAFLSVRNIYDDEYSNLVYVGLTLPQVVHVANSQDVHPPGMYVLTNLAYRVIPSPRWINLFSLLGLYAGLTTFLLAVTPLFRSRGSQLCFVLLVSLHPQLLMWGNTIRWYSWWTGLALVTLIVALRPERGDAGASPDEALRFGNGRAIVLALLLAALFYLNYITLVFGAALGLALLFRYRLRAWKQYLLTLGVFCLLIYPQVHPFLTVHIPSGKNQQSSFLLSLARLVQATLSSEAFLPWHPLAILALLVFGALLVAGIVQAVRTRPLGLRAALLTPDHGLGSIVLFSFVFFALVAAAGFGFKPRNGLLLVPVLAAPCALALGGLRGRWQAGALIILALWTGVGLSHLVRREGLTKANMNNRPEELVRILRTTKAPDCAVVVTYDSLMNLTVASGRLPRVLLLTSEGSPVPLSSPPFPGSSCRSVTLFRVRSYLGGLGHWGERLSAEMNAAGAGLAEPAQTLNLSYDSDAARKRKFAFISGAADLPDYRYIVTVNRITPAEFQSVEQKLPQFAPADDRSKRRPFAVSVPDVPSTAGGG